MRVGVVILASRVEKKLSPEEVKFRAPPRARSRARAHAIMLRALLLTALAAHAVRRGGAIIAPDLSLDTVPIGYFGGNAERRGEANIEMLAKCRLVMLEKWEGHCWQACLAQGPGSAPCQPSCDAEASIMETMRRIKAVNPKVATVMYLNTLLAFPFYALVGKYQAANALTLDAVTKKPIAIRNDNGMEGIFVWGFDTAAGQQLYLDAIRNYTYSGVVDGFFGDKWNKGATPVDRTRPDGGWEICNKECGNVTAEQGRAWNEGKAKVLKAATEFVGDGPYFSYGWYVSGTPEGNVSSNLDGNWQGAPGLKPGTDPRDFITSVQGWLHGVRKSASLCCVVFSNQNSSFAKTGSGHNCFESREKTIETNAGSRRDAHLSAAQIRLHEPY